MQRTLLAVLLPTFLLAKSGLAQDEETPTSPHKERLELTIAHINDFHARFDEMNVLSGLILCILGPYPYEPTEQ